MILTTCTLHYYYVFSFSNFHFICHLGVKTEHACAWKVYKEVAHNTSILFISNSFLSSQSLQEDISNHRQDVEDVIDKGEALVKSEKTDEIHCTEIKNEVLLLHERWEKLEILSQRLHKR